MKKNIIIILFFLNSIYIIGQTVTHTTLAGSLWQGYLNGTGTTAQFNHPHGVYADVNGNIYVADTQNCVIRKVTPQGVATTIAGQGICTFNDGISTLANFRYPFGVTIDSNEIIYVADSSNNRVRKITPSGYVSTFAGQVNSGSTDGIGINAKFNGLTGICTDSNGNIYTADSGSSKIRKITPLGMVTTIAGSTAGYLDDIGTNAKFNKPNGICIDSNDNLYVADTNNNRIRKITPSGIVSTIAGSTLGFADGVGNSALFNKPSGICVDSNGNIYVADTYNAKIRKISPLGEVTTFQGLTTYPGGSQNIFQYPYGICCDVNGYLYVVDAAGNNITKIIQSSLGLNEYKNIVFEFTISPNPVTSILNIQLVNFTPSQEISITDIQGKIIHTQKLEGLSTSINTSSFEKGIYFLNLVDGTQKTTKKFVVE